MFQSTHPHGVRPDTHHKRRNHSWRFNPRTHTGYDLYHYRPLCISRRFQSTHPHGVRPGCNLTVIHSITVSIHAPTRGTTALILFCFYSYRVSIHAPTRGTTIIVFIKMITVINVSIHAPTRGTTVTCLVLLTFPRGFNPRTHTGYDTDRDVRYLGLIGFNPRTHTGYDLYPSLA